MNASARSKKNKKISKSSPDKIGKGKPLLQFSNVFFIHAIAGSPLGLANALCFCETMNSFNCIPNHVNADKIKFINKPL